MKQKKSFWIVAGVIFVITLCCAAVFGKTKPLPSYIDTSSIAETTAAETVIDLIPYTTTTEFRIGIPIDWQRVNKNGNIVFIHKMSASSIEIQEEDYNPQITVMTEAMAASQAVAAGFDFGQLSWINNSSFLLTYSKDTSFNFIEAVSFDRSHIIRVIYTINTQYYEKLEKTIQKSLDSIVWERPNPIPEHFFLQYNEFGNFEFGTPIGWTSGISNGTYYAQDPQTSANMIISVAQSSVTYENISELDYVAIASQNKDNFVLRSYVCDKGIIRGTAVYTYNNQQFMMMQYLIANGSYEYNITFECPVSVYEQIAELYNEEISLFRIF